MIELSAGDTWILELRSTAIRAIRAIPGMKEEERAWLLGIAIEAAQSIVEALKTRRNQSPYTVNAALSAASSMGRLRNLMENGLHDIAMDRLQWETAPILLHLQKELDYWINIHGNSAAGHEALARQRLDLEGYKLELDDVLERDYPFDVSIFVLMCNKFQYSKLCLESIYQYTDLEGMRAEIITIDNGSTDETAAYIESLPHKKKIRLAANAGYTAVNIGLYASEGRYFASLNNDIIATPHWLENLLCCIKSDKRNAHASPVLNSISNYQSIPVSYRDPMQDQSEMLEFAKNYNVSDPAKWEERARILPSVEIGVTQLFARFPFDQRYYDGFYIDDDISTLFRRAGLRQILAKDTFMHHFGSVSMHGVAELADKYKRMRRAFYEKWGVDAWEGAEFNMPVIYQAAREIENGVINLLAIDPDFGSTALQIKNESRLKGVLLNQICAVVTDLRYLDDAKALFDQCSTGGLIDALSACPEGQFEIICFNRPIEQYINLMLPEAFQLLAKKLTQTGRVFFTAANPQYAPNIIAMANGLVGTDWMGTVSAPRYTSPRALQTMIEENGFHVDILPVTQPYVNQADLDAAAGLLHDKENVNLLNVREFLFTCTLV